MISSSGIRGSAAALVTIIGLAACGGEAERTQASEARAVAPEQIPLADGDMCVPLPDGYYLAEDGVFTPVADISALVGAQSPDPDAFAARINDRFPGLGFDWLRLDVRSGIAFLTGTAPDAETRRVAYQSARDAILTDPDASDVLTGRGAVVNAIRLRNDERTVGSAALALEANPDISACREAFVETMDGRNVEFEINSATLNAESTQLLDAVSAIAVICTRAGDIAIEIGGHTDLSGDAGDNLILSQNRAQRVRTYLLDIGVAPDAVTARGFGEGNPLIEGESEYANQRNRRTEFTLRPRDP